MEHIVALSGGKDSTAMALMLREIHPEIQFTYVCTPTGDELPEMVEHWAHLQELLETKLTLITTGQSLSGLITRWNALPNWRQRWCTRVLKIEPFRDYLASHMPCTIYVGIRADEAEDREGVEYEGQVTRRFPLVEWNWGLGDVLAYLEMRGVTVPKRTDCGMCFFQTLGEWHTLWSEHPDRYERACQLEDTTGHTFRSPSRDTQPASLRELAAKFTAGYAPKPSSMRDRKIMCSTCAH